MKTYLKILDENMMEDEIRNLSKRPIKTIN